MAEQNGSKDLMNDSFLLKNFLVKLNRVLSEPEKESIKRQIIEYCNESELQVPSDLSSNGSFLAVISFAYKHTLISPQNTDFLFQLIDDCKDPDIYQELLDTEKSFKKVTYKKMSKAVTFDETPSNKYPNILSVSESLNYSSPPQPSQKKAESVSFKRSRSKSCGDHLISPLLTDAQVVEYASQIGPYDWKRIAVIGLKMSLTEVDRIDYDCKTIQDKILKVFSYWKNVSFGSSSCPPYTKKGLKQILNAAELNNLIYTFEL